jgi:hypothetical protein
MSFQDYQSANMKYVPDFPLDFNHEGNSYEQMKNLTLFKARNEKL